MSRRISVCVGLPLLVLWSGDGCLPSTAWREREGASKWPDRNRNPTALRGRLGMRHPPTGWKRSLAVIGQSRTCKGLGSGYGFTWACWKQFLGSFSKKYKVTDRHIYVYIDSASIDDSHSPDVLCSDPLLGS